MKYIIFLCFSISLIWGCSQEDSQVSSSSDDLIKYLEDKYNIVIVSTPPILTDSIVVNFEKKLVKDREGFYQAGIRSKAIYDSLINLANNNKSIITKTDINPLNCTAISTDMYEGVVRVRVTSFVNRSTNSASVVPQVKHNVPTTERWTFDGENVEYDGQTKVVTFSILGTRRFEFDNIGIQQNFTISGSANHSECIVGMSIFFD